MGWSSTPSLVVVPPLFFLSHPFFFCYHKTRASGPPTPPHSKTPISLSFHTPEYSPTSVTPKKATIVAAAAV